MKLLDGKLLAKISYRTKNYSLLSRLILKSKLSYC